MSDEPKGYKGVPMMWSDPDGRTEDGWLAYGEIDGPAPTWRERIRWSIRPVRLRIQRLWRRLRGKPEPPAPWA